jgi:hypothetical protein
MSVDKQARIFAGCKRLHLKRSHQPKRKNEKKMGQAI